MPTTQKRWLVVVATATALLGLAYVVLMPPGLPYDEPSHWLNVEFYVHHHRLPVIDEPGVTYEAQMGPVAYVLAALLAAPLGAGEAAFYAVRCLGLLQLVALVVVVHELTRRALPDRPRAALLAAAAVGLDPMLLAVSTSVQNDMLMLLLCGLAVLLAVGPGPSRGRALVIGVVTGLALLTKVSAWPVAVVLGGWLLARRQVGAALLHGGAAVVVAGWWFVRNLRLYGDLTGKAGVDAAGYEFPPLGWRPVEMVREVVTSTWLPVEYVRNAISAPEVVEALVGVLMVAGVVGCLLAFAEGSATWRLLVAVAVVSVVGWVVVVADVQDVAFRVGYPALLAFFVGLGALARRRVVTVGVLGVLGLVNCWFLLALSGLADPGLLGGFS